MKIIVAMRKTRAKSTNPKIGSLKKMSNINKPLARKTKEKVEKNQIIKIRNERGNICVDLTEIREYYVVYGNELTNLHKMDKFLGRCKLLKLIQE